MRLTSFCTLVALGARVGAPHSLWTPSFSRLAFQRRLKTAEHACGVEDNKNKFASIQVTADQVKIKKDDPVADAVENPCEEPENLDEATRRQMCESPWRHDGTWPGIDPSGSWSQDEKLHAYLFTYTLYAGAPGAIAGMLDAATSLAGVQIVHTAVVLCQGGDQDTRNQAFQDWCKTTYGGTPDSCWANLQQQQSQCGDADCRVDLAALSQLSCKEVGFFEGWGVMVDEAPQFNDFGDTNPQVFWLGTVTPAQANDVLASVISCKGGDFNPGTYDAVAHNCHAFAEAYMAELKFPVWANTTGRLPAAMEPEVSSGTGIMAGVASWVGDGSWQPSPDCQPPSAQVASAAGGEAP